MNITHFQVFYFLLMTLLLACGQQQVAPGQRIDSNTQFLQINDNSYRLIIQSDDNLATSPGLDYTTELWISSNAYSIPNVLLPNIPGSTQYVLDQVFQSGDTYDVIINKNYNYTQCQLLQGTLSGTFVNQDIILQIDCTQ